MPLRTSVLLAASTFPIYPKIRKYIDEDNRVSYIIVEFFGFFLKRGLSKMAAEEGWVGIREVAAHLQVARDTVYRWVDSKGLPAHRVGRLLRFRLSEVDEWVQNSSGDESEQNPSGKMAQDERDD